VQGILLYRRDDGSISERAGEAELAGLARRYAAAPLREIERSVGTVTIRLREPDEDEEAASPARPGRPTPATSPFRIGSSDR
jgi:hypothetical protein